MSDAKFSPDRARKAIEQSGRTREWIAGACGIDTSYLSQLLCGRRNPGKPLQILLARVLEVDERELLEQERAS